MKRNFGNPQFSETFAAGFIIVEINKNKIINKKKKKNKMKNT